MFGWAVARSAADPRVDMPKEAKMATTKTSARGISDPKAIQKQETEGEYIRPPPSVTSFAHGRVKMAQGDIHSGGFFSPKPPASMQR